MNAVTLAVFFIINWNFNYCTDCPKIQVEYGSFELMRYYAQIRHLQELVVFDEDLHCSYSRLKKLYSVAIQANINIAVKSLSIKTKLKDILVLQRNRLGVIVHFRKNETLLKTFMEKASKEYLFNAYYLWLMIIRTNDYKNVLNLIKNSAIGADSDFVIAIKDTKFIYANYNISFHKKALTKNELKKEAKETIIVKNKKTKSKIKEVEDRKKREVNAQIQKEPKYSNPIDENLFKDTRKKRENSPNKIFKNVKIISNKKSWSSKSETNGELPPKKHAVFQSEFVNDTVQMTDDKPISHKSDFRGTKIIKNDEKIQVFHFDNQNPDKESNTQQNGYNLKNFDKHNPKTSNVNINSSTKTENNSSGKREKTPDLKADMSGSKQNVQEFSQPSKLKNETQNRTKMASAQKYGHSDYHDFPFVHDDIPPDHTLFPDHGGNNHDFFPMYHEEEEHEIPFDVDLPFEHSLTTKRAYDDEKRITRNTNNDHGKVTTKKYEDRRTTTNYYNDDRNKVTKIYNRGNTPSSNNDDRKSTTKFHNDHWSTKHFFPDDKVGIHSTTFFTQKGVSKRPPTFFEAGFKPKPGFGTNETDFWNCCHVDESRGLKNQTVYGYRLFQILKLQQNKNTSMLVTDLGNLEFIKSRAEFEELFTKITVLENQTINVGVRERNPDNIKRSYNENEVDSETADVTILNDLIDNFEITTGAKYKINYYERIGFKHHEGVWTEMFGALANQKIDIVFDFIVADSEMQKDFSFSQPLLETRRNLYYRKNSSRLLRDIFIYPFSILLFCALIGTTIIIFAIVYLVRNMAAIKSKIDERNETNASEAGIITVGIVCMQGTSWNPLDYSGKLVLIFSLLFALVIYNSYQAAITSILSVEESSIQDFDDLIRLQYKFGFIKGGADEQYLKNAVDKRLRQIFLFGVYANAVDSPSEGLDRIMDEDLVIFLPAFIARRLILKRKPSFQRCEIKELTLKETNVPISFPMSKQSPLKRIINIALIRMHEVGVIKKLNAAIKPDMPDCLTTQNFIGASFADVYTAFVMLGFCMVLSVAIFAMENIWYRRNNYKKRNLRNAHKLLSKRVQMLYKHKGIGHEKLDLYNP